MDEDDSSDLSQTQNTPQPPSAPPTRFPTTLSDLHPLPKDQRLYTTLKNLRHATLSLHNRLTSILSDSHFIQRVSTHYALPLIANERCGSWYIPPALKHGSVYFKSTDGHHGQWDFSLRRLNLQLLTVLGERGGAVVVDSTRRGKSVPDSLSKTVPGWVAVVNRVLWPERKEWGGVQVRASEVGESERVQMEGRVERWCQGLRGLGLDLERLRREARRPICLRWAVNGEWDEDESWEGTSDVSMLVLCSASRRVRGAEASEGGYIQGSGDDHEGWSHGLTPELFWEKQDLLMKTPEDELPGLIESLRSSQAAIQRASGFNKEDVLIKPTIIVHIGVEARTTKQYCLTINCQASGATDHPSIFNLGCRQGKLGSKDLREKLSEVRAAVEQRLSSQSSELTSILITCDSGRDLSIGAALAILCVFFDDNGSLRVSETPSFDKHLIKQRMAWITTSKADVNPSRATLQAVNSFLIARPD